MRFLRTTLAMMSVLAQAIAIVESLALGYFNDLVVMRESEP